MISTYQGLLVSQSGDSTALTNTTTATTILHPSARITIPATFLFYPGQALRIRAMGRISTLNPTPGTLTFNVRFGSVTVATSGAIAINTTAAKTNVIWILDWDLTMRTAGDGTVATIMHSGQWQSEAVIGSAAASAGGQGSMSFPTSAPAIGTGFDSTVDNKFDLQGAWSVANAANSILTHTFKLESLN